MKYEKWGGKEKLNLQRYEWKDYEIVLRTDSDTVLMTFSRRGKLKHAKSTDKKGETLQEHEQKFENRFKKFQEYIDHNHEVKLYKDSIKVQKIILQSMREYASNENS